MLKIILFSFVVFAFVGQVNASEKHDEHKEDHKEGHKDDHKDEHDEEAKLDGFKMTPASIKTFELKFVKYLGVKTLVTKDAIYKGLDEVNLYRVRDGLFKRIDFKILSKEKNSYFISSPNLKVGDEIVTSGVGFLRMAEIAASGGLESSHSH